MKLTIRFADQIVGALIILALGILVFVIFMLGSSQRWFSRDYDFKTYFQSASGLSQNMAVHYKGFTIGRVKSIQLTEDDRVEVNFTIFDTYISRVRQGSLVEILVSPISALGGNQFMFYPGLGAELIPEGEVIPSVNSPSGKQLQAAGLAVRPVRDDSINNIMTSVGTLLDTLNVLIADMQEAFEGSSRTSLGRTMAEIEGAAGGLRNMSEKIPADLEGGLADLVAQIEPILANLQVLSQELAAPDNALAAVLDSEGDVYTNLVASLEGISANLENLEKTTAFVPSQLPQVALMLAELQTALVTAQDVLVSLTNNPLLKKGIPERRETNVGGTSGRELEF